MMTEYLGSFAVPTSAYVGGCAMRPSGGGDTPKFGSKRAPARVVVRRFLCDGLKEKPRLRSALVRDGVVFSRAQ